MNELTDLEICQRIAEIEGEEHYISDNKKYCMARDKSSTYVIRHVEYNPLTDDALCFKLMIKYGIIPMTARPDKGEVMGYNAWYYGLIDKVFVAGLNPKKAICLAIIKSKE